MNSRLLQPSILLVDIGNTSVTLGLARGRRVKAIGRVPTRASGGRTVAVALARQLHGRGVADAILCSVVPSVNAAWVRAIRAAVGRAPLIVGGALHLGLELDYPDRAHVGADRLVNASGALHRYGAPVIVADFGTGLTVDVVDRRGAFIGGVIAPGPALMTDYLAERTAQLPRLDWLSVRRTGRGRPRAIGRNTAEAMRAGAVLGYAGLVESILRGVRGALGARRVTCVATGGYAARLAAASVWPYRVDPNLTLFGLARIYALNARV